MIGTTSASQSAMLAGKVAMAQIIREARMQGALRGRRAPDEDSG